MSAARAAAVALLCAVPCAAHAQAVTIEGIARSVSLFTLVETACAGTHDINTDLARRFRMAFTEVGIRQAGEDTFGRMLDDELERRRGEVNDTGAQDWCDAQRERLKSMGVEGVFGK